MQTRFLYARAERCVTVWEHPLWSGVLAAIVYAAFTARAYQSLHWYATPHAYFTYLADAFLHRQLHLRLIPTHTLDLSQYQGLFYLYWPPLPAVLLMPFVAVWGVSFSDTLFSVCVGGLNVSLVAVLLRRASRRGVLELSKARRGLMVLFFALGTVHVTLAPYGGVWFVGQLVGFNCVALAYIATLSLRGVGAFAGVGLTMAGAFLTRNHLILTGLWPVLYLVAQHRGVGERRLLAYLAAGAAPVVAAIVLFGLYNWLRFGSVFDNGLAYHQMSSFFRADYERYGAFSLHYLPTNLFYQYIAYPLPLRAESPIGGSLFLLSPVFMALFWALLRGRPRWSIAVMLLTVLLTAMPILLLMGTGYRQYGPRYTLDFTLPLLLLTAIGVRWWPRSIFAVLICVSVAHYLYGASVMRAILSEL